MEFEVVSYLESDSNLDTLLGAVSGDTKIYPDQTPQGSAKSNHIIYSITADGTTEENILENTITIKAVATSRAAAKNILDKVDDLLDIDDDIYDAISSSNYYFYWSKKVGGRSYKDPNTDMWVRVGVYDFIYAEQ